MKTLSLLFGLLLFKIVFCSAQNTKIKWQENLGGPGVDIGESIEQTKDNGFICAGYSNSQSADVTGNHGDFDYWIAKLNNNGILQWEKSYGGSKSDQAYSVKQTTDGGYIIAGIAASVDGDVKGSHEGSHSVVTDYWIVKTDSLGNIQWKYCYGGKLEDFAFDVELTADNGYIVAGSTDSYDGNVTGNKGMTNAWIIKLNSNGKLMWEKAYGGSKIENARSIKQLNDHGYIFTGASYSNDGDVTGHHGTTTLDDYWVVRIDSVGNILWEKSYGGTGDDYPTSIAQASSSFSGDFFISGFSTSHDGDVTGNHGNRDYWIIKVDPNGNLLNQVSLGGSFEDDAYSVKAMNDGGCIVAGFSTSKNGNVKNHHGMVGTGDYWIVRLDSTLKLIGQIDLGGTSNDQAYDIVNVTQGGYAVIGHSLSTDGDITGPKGSDDYWVVQLKKSALQTPLQTVDAKQGLKEGELAVYPTITTGTFQINRKTTTITDQLVNIQVFNSIGQLILTKQTEMIHGTLEAKIELNPLLPGGMYFVKTSLSNQQYVGKILLARDR